MLQRENKEECQLAGIDLGTTFSVIAVWTGARAEALQKWTGGYEFQSVLYCSPKDGAISLGEEGYVRGLGDPDNMIVGVKRKMRDGKQPIMLGGRTFTPIAISAEILKTIYDDQKKRIPGFAPRGVVVTVPYYFKEPERRSTQAAAELAGFTFLGILEEPIARSLAYAMQLALSDPTARRKETILVFDLGGGTFDLTLFDLEQNGNRLRFEVLASGGDNFLGGLDFDERLLSVVEAKSSVQLAGLDPAKRNRARKALLPEVETAKRRLSAVLEWPVSHQNAVPGEVIDVTVTRAEFEASIAKERRRIETLLDDLWETAGTRDTHGNLVPFDPRKVDRVIRVGGSSRIPCMTDLLDRVVGKDNQGNSKVRGDINESLCVAEGAAIYAAYIEAQEMRRKGKPTSFPVEIELVTRTSHTLGVEIGGGLFFPMIPRNTPTPKTMQHQFNPAADGAEALEVRVFQGENNQVKFNTLVATVRVPNDPTLPRSKVKILITFEVDQKNKVIVTVNLNGKEYKEYVEYA